MRSRRFVQTLGRLEQVTTSGLGRPSPGLKLAPLWVDLESVARSRGQERRQASIGARLATATVIILALAVLLAASLLTRHERSKLDERKQQAAGRLMDQLAIALLAPLEFD